MFSVNAKRSNNEKYERYILSIFRGLLDLLKSFDILPIIVIVFTKTYYFSDDLTIFY